MLRSTWKNQLLKVFLPAAVFAAYTFVPADVCAGGEKAITLEEAYHSALIHNESISASRYRVEQVKEDIRLARAPMLPQIQLRGRSVRLKETTGPTGISGPDGYNEASIQASQVLFQGGKLKSGLDASRYVADGSGLDDYRTRQQILFAVSHNFYNVLFARRSMEIAENRLIRSERHLELAEQRREVGLVDITAVLRAQVQVSAAMEAMEESENNYIVAMQRLALEMGVPEPPASVSEPEPLEIEDAPVEKHIEIAFENRADLMASEKWLMASKKQVEANQADFMPSLSLEGSYSLVDDDAVYYGDDYNWQAALVLSYPLFTGFRNTAQVARSKAQEAERQASFNRMKQEIKLDVRSAHADIQTRKKMITHLENQVESARANYEQISAMFEEGVASTIDVIDAQTALNESELSLANIYYQLQLDQLDLKLATGTFLEDILDTPKERY